jgi:hypothetical protein
MFGETYVLLILVWYLPAVAVDGLRDPASVGAAAAQLMMTKIYKKKTFW